MVNVGGGGWLLLFLVVYRRRVAKVAEVAWFWGGGSALDNVEYLCQPLFCLASRRSASHGSRNSMDSRVA